MTISPSELIGRGVGIISPDILARIQAAVQEAKLKEFPNIIQKSVVEAENTSLDGAMTEETGTGKSSFIMDCGFLVMIKRVLLVLEV